MIAIIVILAVCLLIYLFFPLLKKIKKPSSERKKIRLEKKELKKKLKLEKKQPKEPENEKSKVEDPDIQVEQNNLDVDGFFETNFSPKEESNIELKNDFDDIYDQLFSDSNQESEYDKWARERFDFEADYNPSKDDEIGDYDFEENVKSNDVSSILQNMPDEVKAMVFANILDKKDDIK